MGTIEEWEERIRLWLAGEYRGDALYRFSVLLSQLGDIAKFIYHDPEFNPEARSVGTHEDEVSIYGEAILHLIALMISREIDLSDALEAGIKKLEEKDGYKKKGEIIELDEITTLKGYKTTSGIVEGIAMVIQSASVRNLEKLSGNLPNEAKILVTDSLTPDAVHFLRQMDLDAIITNEGGNTSHGAKIAKEFGIPCVPGTGKATKIIRTGDKIMVNGNAGEVVLKKREVILRKR